MKSLIAFLCIALAPASLAWSQEKEPSEEELRQRCERDLNCARRNSTTDTEFVANATDPELCKGACARHVNVSYPNDSLSAPNLIRPTGSSSPQQSTEREATQ